MGAEYGANWATPMQRRLAQQELSFVLRHVPSTPGQTVLDVGIGTGRVLEALLNHDSVGAVYGVDVAPEMVRVCEEKFGGHPKLKGLSVCDVAREEVPVPGGLSFVSAVRMLKYNANWWDVVETNLVPHIAPGGVLVFSMPNRNSVKFFSRPYAVPYFKTTKKELLRRLGAAPLEPLEVSGFTKLPDPVYGRTRGERLTSALLACERGMDLAIGPDTLTRELFVAARKV